MIEISNPYWEEYTRLGGQLENNWDFFRSPLDRLPLGSIHEYSKSITKSLTIRDVLVNKYAWSITSPKTLRFIVDHLTEPRQIVEIGAGSGYWAWMLSQHGVNVRAFDREKWPGPHRYHNILVGTAAAAGIDRDRTLMLCWPPYDEPMGADALTAYKGKQVVYIGEPAGGCTGCDKMHQLLEGWTLVATQYNVNYYGIKDTAFIYERE